MSRKHNPFVHKTLPEICIAVGFIFQDPMTWDGVAGNTGDGIWIAGENAVAYVAE
jgi:hypothetical protein